MLQSTPQMYRTVIQRQFWHTEQTVFFNLYSEQQNFQRNLNSEQILPGPTTQLPKYYLTLMGCKKFGLQLGYNRRIQVKDEYITKLSDQFTKIRNGKGERVVQLADIEI
eukprot:TRINITY_DN113045_c0_g1_i1.p4 TRINITY_DN113045_c0_g1~~TRINITY_DN113045_c0_g1_i1.p4  ORF type:complete len:109 (-),score=1.02 TRINITY_DN113045_c0_g1_i1:10-336(-)